MDTTSSSNFIYHNIQETEAGFTNFMELPSQGFNILIKAKRFGKWFLLKGLKEEYRHNPVFQEVLRKEFEIMANLSHPSIVSVFSKEEIAPYGMCIVMEYIDGITLTEFMLQQQTEEQRLRIFYGILDAIRYIHSHQVVHRDLKPSNILITHNNRNGIIKRCIAPIEQRFSDIDQLEKALQDVSNRKKRRWLVGLTALTIILASLIVWQSVQLQQLSDERSLSTDSISAMKQMITLTNQKHNEKLKEQEKVITEISDSLERVNLLNQKLSYLEKHEMKVKQSIEDGKKEMDRYMLSTGILQHVDTLSSILYYKADKYSNLATEVLEHAKAYSRQLAPELTENECSQIEYLLHNYVHEKYTKKWLNKITELSKQQY